MEKYGEGYGVGTDDEYGKQSSSIQQQLPTSTTFDTSGFGMYSSGTGTGAITGGGFSDPYATLVRQQQFYPPASTSSAENTTTTTESYGQQAQAHHEKKGFMEKIKEKLPGHHRH